jgi:probable HAF family extracellular repeat protein
MTDLGTLPGDYFSFAWGINNKGQVIAQSCDINFNCRATLWQHGVMTDLNALTPPGSLYLVFASDINDRGEITGQGFDPETGYTLAFLAVPIHDGSEGVLPGTQVRDKVILPEAVRKQLQQRRGFMRFGLR